MVQFPLNQQPKCAITIQPPSIRLTQINRILTLLCKMIFCFFPQFSLTRLFCMKEKSCWISRRLHFNQTMFIVCIVWLIRRHSGPVIMVIKFSKSALLFLACNICLHSQGNLHAIILSRYDSRPDLDTLSSTHFDPSNVFKYIYMGGGGGDGRWTPKNQFHINSTA